MPLKLLGIEDTKVADLAQLKGMKLEKLYLNNTPINNLGPLAGMPLKELMLVGTKVKDLKALKGTPLQSLWLNGTQVSRHITPCRVPAGEPHAGRDKGGRSEAALQDDKPQEAAYRTDPGKRPDSAAAPEARAAGLHTGKHQKRPG